MGAPRHRSTRHSPKWTPSRRRSVAALWTRWSASSSDRNAVSELSRSPYTCCVRSNRGAAQRGDEGSGERADGIVAGHRDRTAHLQHHMQIRLQQLKVAVRRQLHRQKLHEGMHERVAGLHRVEGAQDDVTGRRRQRPQVVHERLESARGRARRARRRTATKQGVGRGVQPDRAQIQNARRRGPSPATLAGSILRAGRRRSLRAALGHRRQEERRCDGGRAHALQPPGER